jgi:hypothetical protein
VPFSRTLSSSCWKTFKLRCLHQVTVKGTQTEWHKWNFNTVHAAVRMLASVSKPLRFNSVSVYRSYLLLLIPVFLSTFENCSIHHLERGQNIFLNDHF